MISAKFLEVGLRNGLSSYADGVHKPASFEYTLKNLIDPELRRELKMQWRDEQTQNDIELWLQNVIAVGWYEDIRILIGSDFNDRYELNIWRRRHPEAAAESIVGISGLRADEVQPVMLTVLARQIQMQQTAYSLEQMG